MRLSTVAASLAVCALASAQTGQLGDAQVFTDNPAGAAYQAVFPNSDKNTVRGSVVASSVGNGQGVQFQVAISGLPSEGGPFSYHIHALQVPADGNCTGTLAHLDPYIRGEEPPCNSAEPATCQVGDMSGKHGKINGTAFSASYVDNYVALKPGVGDFFGNRSIVVHFANKTRITCANFTSLATCEACSPTPMLNATASSGANATPSASGAGTSGMVATLTSTVNGGGSTTTGGPATANSASPTATMNAASKDGFMHNLAAALGVALMFA